MQPFTSERLYYRPFRRSDAAAAFAFFSDPQVMEYSAFGPHPDIERTHEILALFIDHNRRRGFALWAVIERESDELIGLAGLIELDAAGELELAYRLRRDKWGQGYGSEAAQAWVDKAFTALNLPRIVAIVEPGHVVSKRILEKIGMRIVEQRTVHDKLVDYMVLDRPEQGSQ